MPADASVLNIAAYKFVTLTRLDALRCRLREACRARQLRGTILLADEGVNMFLAGEERALEGFLAELSQAAEFQELAVKRSYSRRQPFRRLLVRLKREIIAFGVEQVNPRQHASPKLAPQRLKQWLDEGRDVELLDVRNDYEIEVGTFAQAVPIGVDQFRDFPQAAGKLPAQWREKPVVMFCTGGIRCEKAGPYLEQQGFQKVYQLDGGILNYFERCGDAHYDGDCFVFDQRVAVDPQLQETPLKLCYACQAVLTEPDQESPDYVVGESCPYCHRAADAERAERLEERQRRITAVTTPLPGSQPYDSVRPLRIPEKVDGRLLIDALDTLFPFVGRERWLESCRQGRVTEDGRPLAANATVRAGQQLRHLEPQVVEPDVNGEIRILYEDDDLIAVDKPAPLPMHPCGRFNRNTLVSILNDAYAPVKVRCAHRLDANTSGLVVLTKRRAAASQLQPQFERGEVRKTYLARVHGRPSVAEFVCRTPLNREVGPVGLRTTVAEDDPRGQTATTEFQWQRMSGANESSRAETVLRVRPLTGRTNQIRIHLWHLRMPIVGDPSYLPDGQLGAVQTRSLESDPMCLHAWQIEFQHPITGESMRLRAPKPGWAG